MVGVAGLGAHNLFPLPTRTPASIGWSGRCCRLPPCITRRNYVNNLGILIARGLNRTAKRDEVMDVFREGKFELLALMNTKLK